MLDIRKYTTKHFAERLLERFGMYNDKLATAILKNIATGKSVKQENFQPAGYPDRELHKVVTGKGPIYIVWESKQQKMITVLSADMWTER